jgi:hypothetical protein
MPIFDRTGAPPPLPLCKTARENGGTVPIACLFTCERNCMGEVRQTRDRNGRAVQPLDALPEDDE